MIHGFIDIPYTAIVAAYEAGQKKINVCEVMPSSRFNIYPTRGVKFNGLVCKGFEFERASGVGAQWCNNCIRESEDEK